MNLILPTNTERVVPDWFAKALYSTDPNLIVYFNPLKQRWIIDRCTRDGEFKTIPHTHDGTCPKTNVMVVSDPETKDYMPLCDQVLDFIRSRDAWSNYGSLDNYRASNAEKEAATQAAIDKAVKDLYDEAGKDDKRQLTRAFDLIQRHDCDRIH
jgi:hypothetical protein